MFDANFKADHRLQYTHKYKKLWGVSFFFKYQNNNTETQQLCYHHEQKNEKKKYRKKLNIFKIYKYQYEKLSFDTIYNDHLCLCPESMKVFTTWTQFLCFLLNNLIEQKKEPLTTNGMRLMNVFVTSSRLFLCFEWSLDS